MKKCKAIFILVLIWISWLFSTNIL